MDTKNVTRIEIIDYQSKPIVGRDYIKYNCEKSRNTITR